MPKKSKLGPVHFNLRNPEDKETLDRMQEDPDYTGFEVTWTTDVVGTFLDVPEEETELLAVWYAGTGGIRFGRLDYFGEDLLKKHAKEIKEERRAFQKRIK